MKFLEIEPLEKLNTAFHFETAECTLTGRVEAYSCKSAGSDKKLSKELAHRYTTVSMGGNQLQIPAPSLDEFAHSPDDVLIMRQFGRLSESTPLKTFFYLLSTLNTAFPEHDFADVRPDQFVKLPSLDIVTENVHAALFNHGGERIVTEYRLWNIIDEQIGFQDCDIYRFVPDEDDDPMNEEEGYIWATNYFFFSRKLKRVIFFWMRLNGHTLDDMEEEDYDDGPAALGDMEM